MPSSPCSGEFFGDDIALSHKAKRLRLSKSKGHIKILSFNSLRRIPFHAKDNFSVAALGESFCACDYEGMVECLHIV